MPIPISGGYYATRGGEVVVGFFTRTPGFTPVQRGSIYHSNYSGAATTRNYTYPVNTDGLGANTEFTIQVVEQYELGGTASLTSVTYKTANGTVPDNSAAPNGGTFDVPFVALGGGSVGSEP